MVAPNRYSELTFTGRGKARPKIQGGNYEDRPARRGCRHRGCFALAVCSERRAGEARPHEHGRRLSGRDGDPGPGQISFAERVKKISGGSIDLRFSEPGALVPASQYFDAVAVGSLDSAWTSLGFFTGKDIAFAMFSSVPFGPEHRRISRLDEARAAARS